MPEDLCKDVLLYTQKYAMHTINSQSDYEKFVSSWLQTASYEEYLKMRSTGWQANVDFDIVDIVSGGGGGGSTLSEKEFKSLQNSLSQGSVIKLKDGKSYSEVHEEINRYAIAAWQTCIIQKYQGRTVPEEENQGGTIEDNIYNPGLWKKITPIGENIIRIIFRYNSANSTRPKIKKISVIGGKVMEGSAKVGEIIEGDMLITIEREHRKALGISILTEQGFITYDLPEIKTPNLILKRFIFNLDLKNIKGNHLYTFSIPPEYKSIAAFPPGDFGPFGLYPTSLQEWNFETPYFTPISSATLSVIITAIYDPDNNWEVMIAENTVEGGSICEAQLPEGYSITSGAYRIKVDWRGFVRDPNIILTECESFLLLNFYPKDKSTFLVQTTDVCNKNKEDYKSPRSSLTAYALGLYLGEIGDVQHTIESFTEDGILKLKDKTFKSTGGVGYKSEMPYTSPIYSNYNLENNEYTVYSGGAIKYLIGIKNSNFEIGYQETLTQQISKD
ncbi:hypothetical protein AT268_12980 [Bacillus cereus]|uniref:Uncharacterized protein n=1 Tax=Bacillus cereus TaxID=1396 RepID=A0A9X0M9X3_BACCE|nr:hypothetical protein [Bacillus cereus]KXY27353.1 hypothetical protein AT268_12980 [Bacillus cereus]TKH92070.1 hypothetical protein FC685_00185 [Bacillus cereus]